MLKTTEIKAAAHSLYSAELNRVQIGLLTQEYPNIEMTDAYSIQKALVQLKIESGRKIVGWKIGLTSKAMQYALNIDIPDSGVLLDDMEFSNDSEIPSGKFIQPRIEAEIAFVMKSSLGGDVSVEDVIQATDFVCPALEILDTRILRLDSITGKSRGICDTISDNAANAGVILGDKRHSPRDIDLRWVGAIVSRDGEVEETGLGAGVLNDPIMGIVWLAKRMSDYGQKIEEGQIILSGSFIRAIEVPSGSRINADFGSFGRAGCVFL